MKDQMPTKQIAILLTSERYDMLIQLMRLLGHKTIDETVSECIFTFWMQLVSNWTENDENLTDVV